jgi:uncharacterized surface protein with fasciclin (FAS1) repeats
MQSSFAFVCILLIATSSGAFGNTVVDVIEGHSGLKTLAAALKASGLNSALEGSGPFTVFAPVDNAFVANNMQDFKLKFLLDKANVESLQTLLKYHVLGNVERKASSFNNKDNLTTLEGSDLFVAKNATGLEINDVNCAKSHIIAADLAASNGIVHIVSEVFVPFGVFCPDTIFAAEQRDQARISSYGYDCRRKGTKHLTNQEATKPVGLAVDDSTKQIFWSNDMDYPHGAPTSWLSKSTFAGNVTSHFVKSVDDPQGMDTAESEQKLYWTQHYGNAVMRSNYDGSDTETLVTKQGNESFQPSDVAVDEIAGRMFVSVEGNEDIYGSLYSYNLNGTGETLLKSNLNRPYGLCVDNLKSHVYYIQGGHGGSISCLAYGATPCVREVFADILEYPYMCDVDNAFSKYGGPTTVLFSQANEPGQIYYITDSPGAKKEKLDVVSADLIAPMGVKFGCVGKDL